MSRFVCLFVFFLYSGSIYSPFANHSVNRVPGLQLIQVANDFCQHIGYSCRQQTGKTQGFQKILECR